ncbi:hypothetical protein WA026_022656 [Henosepilachna vigintioctopunctata]|uniref:CCHC-type domain-containing protein n=1 Tax=Henosepilachna vigintioctopunctata TaxID=420089 RepID=A0AAW1UD07_9CUCU
MSNECEELKKFDKEYRQMENCSQSHLQQIDNRFFKLENGPLTEEELVLCLRNQNNSMREDAVIKLIAIKKIKTRYLAIIQVDPKTSSLLLDTGYVCIQYDTLHVFEPINVILCFKCGGFDHIANKCDEKQMSQMWK